VREKRNSQRMLVGKPEGRRLPGNPGCRWDNIEIKLDGIGWKNVNWFYLPL
jgi:hypothetical protein